MYKLYKKIFGSCDDDLNKHYMQVAPIIETIEPEDKNTSKEYYEKELNRAIRYNNVEKVKKIIDIVEPSNKYFTAYVDGRHQDGDVYGEEINKIEEIIDILQQKIKYNKNDGNELIYVLIAEGVSYKVIRIFLNYKQFDPSENNNKALRDIIKYKISFKFNNFKNDKNALKIINLLLNDPRVDPSIKDNKLILNLCKCKYTNKIVIDIIKKLIADDRVEISEELLIEATKAGNYKIVIELLKSNQFINNKFLIEYVKEIAESNDDNYMVSKYLKLYLQHNFD